MNLILGQRVFDVCEKELFNVSILLKCVMHARLLLNNYLLDTYQLNLEQCET